MTPVFAPPETPSVAVLGTDARFPVHRIYCVGRNYAQHAREMGADPEREPPFFFTKPADAVVASGAPVPYPPRTRNLHHEVELVIAIGRGGRDIAAATALEHVFGYAVGNDLTRRDLQNAAKDHGRPWDTGKAFDASAPLTAIHPAAQLGHPDRGAIWMEVNGQGRQKGDLSEMIWKVPEVIHELSTLFCLRPGDLIFSGTPAGVAAVQVGDQLVGGIEGFAETLRTLIAPPAVDT